MWGHWQRDQALALLFVLAFGIHSLWRDTLVLPQHNVLDFVGSPLEAILLRGVNGEWKRGTGGGVEEAGGGENLGNGFGTLNEKKSLLKHKFKNGKPKKERK